MTMKKDAEGEPRRLEEMTKEEVADLAAVLFSYQLLGPTVLLEVAEMHPWLIDRAPKPAELAAMLDLAQRGKTITDPDQRYNWLYRRLADLDSSVGDDLSRRAAHAALRGTEHLDDVLRGTLLPEVTEG